MANLPETPVWEEGIYQLETTDPVQGGPDGVDNLPNRQLANRTVYLKKQIDELGAPARTVASIAELRALTATNRPVQVLGYYAAGDDGGGLFVWKAASTAEDNGGTVIRPDSVSAGDPGRWERILGPFVTPQMFGARADGVTDDSAAIQAALQAHSWLVLPNGNYVLESVVEVPDYRRIEGSKRRGPNLLVRNSAGGLRVTGRDVQIENLSIICDHAAGTGYGLSIINYYFSCRDVQIDHGAVDGSKKFVNCVLIPPGATPWVHLYDNCLFASSSGDAFLVDSSASSFNHVQFNHCTFRGAGRDGFYLMGSSSHGITFVACRAENNARDGFRIAGRRGNQVSFVNPYVEHNGAAGINLGSSSPAWDTNEHFMEPCTISGLTSWENGQSAVIIGKCAFANIFGASIGASEGGFYSLGGIRPGWGAFPLGGTQVVLSGVVQRGEANDYTLIYPSSYLKNLSD